RGAGATVSSIGAVVAESGPSVATTRKTHLPTAFGVPDRSPEGASVSPGGSSSPAATEKMVPVAANLYAYGPPTDAGGGDAAVNPIGAPLRTTSAGTPVPRALSWTTTNCRSCPTVSRGGVPDSVAVPFPLSVSVTQSGGGVPANGPVSSLNVGVGLPTAASW